MKIYVKILSFPHFLFYGLQSRFYHIPILLELFKHLTINLEQRQANSNLKGSKPHKGATKPE